jgi:tetratricopeptide (TPR) repeat protein
MQISLRSPAAKIASLLAALLLATAYVALCGRQFLASYYSEKPDLAHLERAVRLEPANAEYRFRLGRYLALTQSQPEPVASAYRAAVYLNPHRARYWFELASAYQLLSDTNAQADALEKATLADPKTPDVAWQAANFYLVQGETEKALKEFRTVLENDPPLSNAALQLVWRMTPDIDTILREVIPPDPDAYYALLDALMVRKETGATERAWSQLVQLHKPIEARRVFEYMRFLVAQHEVDQARLVWQQAGVLSGLSAYQPSRENLVVNGDFSLPVLNGGFDWIYYRTPDVSLALDPTQAHTGHRSLSITFNTRPIDDAGIRQLIPVQPGATYDFSANFKAEDLEGAGGPRFLIQDVYNETIYLATEDMGNADFWKPIGGTFTVGPDTRLVVLRIQRDPPGNVIKGRLWIDGVRLEERRPS